MNVREKMETRVKSWREDDILKTGPKSSSMKPSSIGKKLSLNFVGKTVKLIFEKIFYNGLCGQIMNLKN